MRRLHKYDAPVRDATVLDSAIRRAAACGSSILGSTVFNRCALRRAAGSDRATGAAHAGHAATGLPDDLGRHVLQRRPRSLCDDTAANADRCNRRSLCTDGAGSANAAAISAAPIHTAAIPSTGRSAELPVSGSATERHDHARHVRWRRGRSSQRSPAHARFGDERRGGPRLQHAIFVSVGWYVERLRAAVAPAATMAASKTTATASTATWTATTAVRSGSAVSMVCT